jgi:predicted MFS family arabinose efflux permease
MTVSVRAPTRKAQTMGTVRLTALVLAPFAFGYALSYLMRTINAVAADTLTAELALKPAELGFLTSAYFLAMAVVQLPLGVMLDRYGPRRIQSGCLLVAAFGACVFATAPSLPQLLVGRALIGIGFATAFMAGLKAIALWFPPERAAVGNGLLLTLGALGAVAATLPAQTLIDALGWRGVFLLLAWMTGLTAMLIFVVVPEHAPARRSNRHDEAVTLLAIFRDPRFWRVAPLSATSIGTAWALQALWAAPWLTDVEGYDRPDVVQVLFVMAVALCGAGLAFGALVETARKRGFGAGPLFCVTAAVFMTAQLTLALRWPVPPVASWAVIASRVRQRCCVLPS